jgi:putative endonuclease
MIPSSPQNLNTTWYVYILQCHDHTLYTGITIDLERRLREHNTNDRRCARYVKTRRPVKLVYWEPQPGRGAAMQREAAIKKYSREKKLGLFAAKLNVHAHTSPDSG